MIREPRVRPALRSSHSLAMDHWLLGAAWRSGTQRRRATMLLFDCRGHGASSKSARPPFNLSKAVRRRSRRRDGCRWIGRTPVVAGASMGGCVSLAFAARSPGAIVTRALGLVDTTAWYGDKAPANSGRSAPRRRSPTAGSRYSSAFQKSRWFSGRIRKGAHPDVVESAVEVFLANDRGRPMRKPAACSAAPTRRDALARHLTMPDQASWSGRNDYATPPRDGARPCATPSPAIDAGGVGRRCAPDGRIERPDDVAAAASFDLMEIAA